MAGAGYKLFNTGDVLTAAQVNTYLNEQTVMVFASSAARTSALSGVLAEGMMSYLQDTNAVQVYNGSAWVSVGGGASPLTTKGDLYTFSTVDARLGVGANGTVLTAASGEATGLQWATPAGAAFVGCGLRDSGNQTTTGGVDTAVTFNTEYFDTDAFHDTSSNTSRITIPAGKGGKYLFSYTMVNTAPAEANYSQSTIRKNGTAVTGIQTLFSSLTYTTMAQTVILDLVATDYVEVYLLSDTAATIQSYRTFFCQKVG